MQGSTTSRKIQRIIPGKVSGGIYLERTRVSYQERLLEDHTWKTFYWSTIPGKNWWTISGKLFGGSYLWWSTIPGMGPRQCPYILILIYLNFIHLHLVKENSNYHSLHPSLYFYLPDLKELSYIYSSNSASTNIFICMYGGGGRRVCKSSSRKDPRVIQNPRSDGAGGL